MGLRGFLIAALACLVAAAPRAVSAQTIPFARDAVVIESSMDDVGGLIILIMLREADGKLAVCGANWLTDPNGVVRSMRRAALDNLLIILNDNALPVNARNFASYASEDEAVKGGAKCLGTRIPWDPAFAKAELEFRPRNATLRIN